MQQGGYDMVRQMTANDPSVLVVGTAPVERWSGPCTPRRPLEPAICGAGADLWPGARWVAQRGTSALPPTTDARVVSAASRHGDQSRDRGLRAPPRRLAPRPRPRLAPVAVAELQSHMGAGKSGPLPTADDTTTALMMTAAATMVRPVSASAGDGSPQHRTTGFTKRRSPRSTAC